MFRKQLKIKNNTQVKSSERKLIREQVQKNFPKLSEEDLNIIFPKKEGLNKLKIATASDEIVHVYTIQKQPLFFETKDKLFPTVYVLWQFPDLIHAFTTHEQVMSFIHSGADLMLPGVMLPPNESGVAKYGNVQKNDPVAINLSRNRSALAVGVASEHATTMVQSGNKGRCVSVYHTFGDKLCTLEGSCLPIPNAGPPLWLSLKSYVDDFPALGQSSDRRKTINEEKLESNSEHNGNNILENSLVSTESGEISTEVAEDMKENELKNSNTELTTEEMDELLYSCFLAAIKYSKTLVLPILTSNFFKLQILASCPTDKTLDIKKSSYKKLKPFLDKMCQENIITIKEVKKGVESVVAINKEHPKFSEFFLKKEDRPAVETKDSEAPSTSVTESFIITPTLLPVFAGTGFQKGNSLPPAEVRKHVRDYVTKNQCLHQENPKLIKPNEVLEKICKTTNYITWEELFERVFDSMKNCYKVSSQMEEIVNKGKVSPITINVANRSGNKKVTLVDNLELFGIRIPDFAKECQHGVAASTSISRPPGKKTDQLLVQGNQVIFVYNLLTEKYKVPKRYVKGLENAPKKKK